MEKSVQVDIEDGDKVITSFIVERANIGQTARRFNLTSAVMDLEVSDHEKNQMLNCCALASVLKTVDGEYAYPGDDGATKIYDEMDYEMSAILVQTYLELNPTSGSLTAKKKTF